MATVAEQKSKNTPRFMKLQCGKVYGLFDAFVRAVIMDDRAVDFAVDPEVLEDGSFKFAEREEKFSDIVRGIPSFDCFKESKKQTDGEKAAREKCVSENLLLLAHLNWLWTLGMCNAATSCGKDAVNGLGLKDSGVAFTGKDGLWNAGLATTNKFNDLSLLWAVLKQTVTLAKRDFRSSLESVKAEIVLQCLKLRLESTASIRNGLLHFCDPDLYIHLYSAEDKANVVKQHSSLLESFRQNPLKFRGLPATFKTKDYQALITDEQIQFIYDRLSASAASQAMEQEEFWRLYFYRQAVPKKPAKKA